jgi:hypothetical protein
VASDKVRLGLIPATTAQSHLRRAGHSCRANGVRYIGEFEVDGEHPWYRDDAPETNGGPIRQVIVFRLRPNDSATARAPDAAVSPAPKDSVTEVPVEEQYTERVYTDPGREPYEAERREAKLVFRYRNWLRAQGHEVARLKVVPEGERKPLFNDIWDKTGNELVEAKGAGTREAIRMAIGQLSDYSRFLETNPKLCVLLPAEPRPDLLRLIHSVDLHAVWPVASGFERVS